MKKEEIIKNLRDGSLVIGEFTFWKCDKCNRWHEGNFPFQCPEKQLVDNMEEEHKRDFACLVEQIKDTENSIRADERNKVLDEVKSELLLRLTAVKHNQPKGGETYDSGFCNGRVRLLEDLLEIISKLRGGNI